MSYHQNLGRVKGDKGKVYVPKKVPSVDANGVNKMTIEWELKEETAAAPEPIDITPPVYVPTVDERTGIITFSLMNATSTLINGVNIKGPRGIPGEVNTLVLTEEPSVTDNWLYIDKVKHILNIEENGNLTITVNNIKYTIKRNDEENRDKFLTINNVEYRFNDNYTITVGDVTYRYVPKAREGVIYILPDSVAEVYDELTQKFYKLDNLVKFSDYCTKDQIREKIYTKKEIHDYFLGDVAQAQREILLTLDKGSVDIPNGE